MGNHTPGPWRAARGAGCRAIKAGKAGMHRQGQWTREVAYTVGLSDDAEDLANALLIGAAPRMLAALKELHLKTVVGTDAERHAALTEAWAAICEAENAPARASKPAGGPC